MISQDPGKPRYIISENLGYRRTVSLHMFQQRTSQTGKVCCGFYQVEILMIQPWSHPTTPQCNVPVSLEEAAPVANFSCGISTCVGTISLVWPISSQYCILACSTQFFELIINLFHVKLKFFNWLSTYKPFFFTWHQVDCDLSLTHHPNPKQTTLVKPLRVDSETRPRPWTSGCELANYQQCPGPFTLNHHSSLETPIFLKAIGPHCVAAYALDPYWASHESVHMYFMVKYMHNSFSTQWLHMYVYDSIICS